MSMSLYSFVLLQISTVKLSLRVVFYQLWVVIYQLKFYQLWVVFYRLKPYQLSTAMI